MTLHSSMVRLKQVTEAGIRLLEVPLHSSMVRLKLVDGNNHNIVGKDFTFQHG